MPRCGLFGTITADTIEIEGGRTFRSVGGILYQAAALCGLGVSVALSARGGESMRAAVENETADWPGLDRTGLTYVPGPGHRVRLRYPAGEGEREEILESAVPPLDPGPALEALPGLDFLMMVFNSGFDITPAGWHAVAGRASCPVWMDIHSLALEPRVGSPRGYRAVPDWEAWVEGAAYLQANRREAACLMGRPDREAGESEIEELSRRAFRLGVRAVIVTLGRDGVAVSTPEGFVRIPAAPSPAVVDPTGCGDVFAAAAAEALLSGRTVFEAAVAGAALAARTAGVSGVHEIFGLATRERESRRDRDRPPPPPAGGKGEK